jgi:hypothetical protein
MLDQQKLTDAKQHFDRDGYVIWRGFFDANQMRELMAELDRYIKEVLPTLPPNRAFFEDPGGSVVCASAQLRAFHDTCRDAAR